LRNQGLISKSPIRDQLAAVSVGLVRNQVLLDLCYQEDAAAEVDMNVVMTGEGAFVEVQATGEEATFQREQLDLMLTTAEIGIKNLFQLQNAALKEANTSWSK
jgi:ribonuclease PH